MRISDGTERRRECKAAGRAEAVAVVRRVKNEAADRVRLLVRGIGGVK